MESPLPLTKIKETRARPRVDFERYIRCVLHILKFSTAASPLTIYLSEREKIKGPKKPLIFFVPTYHSVKPLDPGGAFWNMS